MIILFFERKKLSKHTWNLSEKKKATRKRLGKNGTPGRVKTTADQKEHKSLSPICWKKHTLIPKY